MFYYFLMIVAGLSILIFDFVLCGKMADIADAKGYDRTFALCACFFLSVLGFLYVIALPDKNEKGSTSNSIKSYKNSADELPEL